MTDIEAGPRTRFTRRSLLRGGVLAGVGAAAGGLVGGGSVAALDRGSAHKVEPFWGPHQAGVTTAPQGHVVLAAFDLTTSRRADVVAILRSWTRLAAAAATGQALPVPILAASGGAYADATAPSAPDDSGEALGLDPSRLTVTVGFGPGLFRKDGEDRYGLADHRPDALVDLPHFAGDQLQPAVSGGDLLVQACADNPQVAFHAVRTLARVAPDLASVRWIQTGFTGGGAAGTPRNLMGFKDGTMNPSSPAEMDRYIWAGSEGPGWMRGGTYLVYRRIRITLEHWDRLGPTDQERVIGRYKLSGAPLGETSEFAPLDLTAVSPVGQPWLPTNSHVRLSAPAANSGATMLRRAFSYNDGVTPFVERWPPWRQALEYDAGLLFLAFQHDPRAAFIPVFQKLSINDALNQFTTHTASAVVAVPPGPSGPGDWFGRALFA